MTAQQRALLDRLFAEAVALPRQQQQTFLAENCDDPEVGAELGSLLAFDIITRPLGFLDAIGETAASLSGAALIGQRLGPYRLTGKIGQGGMGAVYRAVRDDDQFQQTVAIKMLRFAQGDSVAPQRFRRERQILATLEHPHVARLLDGGAWIPPGGAESQPYLVMEFVEGLPLTAYCEEKKRSLRERLLLFRQVCDALSYAHQRLVVHRDIKPANILVTADGTPKLLDFGIAKLLDLETGPGAGTLTSSGLHAMTPDYASPEQVRGDAVTTVTDVYSLGAVLYELLTGCRPHQLVTYAPLEIASKICEGDVRLPSVAGGRHLRGDLDVIVLRAMQREPARRYRSVEQFSEDIRRYLEGMPVVARPDTLGYRAVKFVQRHRLGVVGVTAIFLTLAGGVAASTWQAMRASLAESAALEDRDRAAVAGRAAKQERDRALSAEQKAAEERNKAVAEKHRADAESATAKAVNEFLRNDLLAQAGATAQAKPGTKPDPDLKVSTALDRAAAGIQGKFAGQPLVEAAIRVTIGKTYLDLGLYTQAGQQLEYALELRRRSLGEEHPDTLNLMNSLGELYVEDSKFTQAEQLLIKLLGVQRRALGDLHEQTLAVMSTLALLYAHEGKFAPAEALSIEALAGRRRVLGEEHSHTRQSMHNLGALYVREGKYRLAEPLLITTLQIDRRSLGDDHPFVLRTMTNLGMFYARQGKYEQAEPLFVENLETQRRALGPEHPDVQTSMNNLGMLYVQLGKYVQAEPLLIKTLDLRRRMLEPEHPDLLKSMNNLGVLYIQAGKYAQAEPLWTELLEVQRRKFGEEHSETLTTRIYLASVYLGQGKPVEAEMLDTKAVQVLSRVSAERQPNTLSAVNSLAMVHRLQGNYGQAHALLTKILEIRRSALGEAHPDTASLSASLGEVRIHLHKYAEAEPLLRAAHSSYLKTGFGGWRRYYSQSALGASLVGQKKYAEAEPHLLIGYKELVQREDTIPAANRSDLKQAREWILRLYQDWGKPDKAVEWLEKLHPGQGAGLVPKP